VIQYVERFARCMTVHRNWILMYVLQWCNG